jgi:hypothetical protein
MLPVQESGPLLMQTTAGFGSTASESLPPDEGFIAAVTATKPLRMNWRCLKRRAFQNDKATAAAASKVDEFHARRYIT